jgi:hypothetical protein
MRKVLALAAVPLAACTATMPPPAPVPDPGDVCRPEGLDRFTGQPATQALGAEMQRVSHARVFQWVGHGMVVTMDFSPHRLRVFLTADNRVERANCG